MDWETLVTFDETQAVRLLRLLKCQRIAPCSMHPTSTCAICALDLLEISADGTMLYPKYSHTCFIVDATIVQDIPTTRTKLLFTEWNRLRIR